MVGWRATGPLAVPPAAILRPASPTISQSFSRVTWEEVVSVLSDHMIEVCWFKTRSPLPHDANTSVKVACIIKQRRWHIAFAITAGVLQISKSFSLCLVIFLFVQWWYWHTLMIISYYLFVYSAEFVFFFFPAIWARDWTGIFLHVWREANGWEKYSSECSYKSSPGACSRSQPSGAEVMGSEAPPAVPSGFFSGKSIPSLAVII